MNVNVNNAGDTFRVKTVSLDGVLVTNNCTEADDISGYVVLIVRDDNGHPLFDGDDIKTEKRYGKVEIVLK